MSIQRLRQIISDRQENYDLLRPFQRAVEEDTAQEIVDEALSIFNSTGRAVSESRKEAVYDFVKANDIIFAPNAIDPNTGDFYAGMVKVFAEFFLRHGYPENSDEHQLLIARREEYLAEIRPMIDAEIAANGGTYEAAFSAMLGNVVSTIKYDGAITYMTPDASERFISDMERYDE